MALSDNEKWVETALWKGFLDYIIMRKGYLPWTMIDKITGLLRGQMLTEIGLKHRYCRLQKIPILLLL